jgi:hypothetical protein
MITSKMSIYLSEQLFAPALHANICKAEKWPSETFDRVDWTSYGKALQKVISYINYPINYVTLITDKV